MFPNHNLNLPQIFNKEKRSKKEIILNVEIWNILYGYIMEIKDCHNVT